MSYTKNEKFVDGEVLHARDLVAMEDAIIQLESNNGNSNFYDLSNEFRAMVQPGWIEYGSGGAAGATASFTNGSTSGTQLHKCGVGHSIYLCNRDFIFSNSTDYEMVVIKMDANLKIMENTGWVSGTYSIKKGECAWFSFILRSADQSSVAGKLNDVVANFKVLVSKEKIDKGSDFPLVLGIMNFSDSGTMNQNTVFTTYSAFNTLSLVYPIMDEKLIEQTVRLNGWYQSLATYDSTSGARMQKLGFFSSMTWVDTLANENLFVQWRKSNGGTITYSEAIAVCESLSIRCVNNNSNRTWVMEKTHPFRASSHRIDAQLAPRNTYSALVFAYNRGRRWFETDIRWTSDKVPVMLHDDNISSVSNSSGSIASMTYEQVSQYDFGSYHSPRFTGEKILRLEDMMRFCLEHDCGMNLEFKDPQTATEFQIVWDMVKKYSLEKQTIFNINGVNSSFINAILDIDDTVELQILPNNNSSSTMDTLATFLRGKNIIHVCLPWTSWTEDTVNYARSKGLKVDAHCVSTQDSITPAIYKQMIDWGLSGIITESANLTFWADELMPLR